MFQPVLSTLSLFAFDGDFPHGAGWYIGFLRLAMALICLLAWCALCQWIDDDQRELEIADGPILTED